MSTGGDGNHEQRERKTDEDQRQTTAAIPRCGKPGPRFYWLLRSIGGFHTMRADPLRLDRPLNSTGKFPATLLLANGDSSAERHCQSPPARSHFSAATLFTFLATIFWPLISKTNPVVAPLSFLTNVTCASIILKKNFVSVSGNASILGCPGAVNIS